MALLIESKDKKTLKPFFALAKQMGLKAKYTEIIINGEKKPKSEFEKKIENELLYYRNAKREKIFQESAIIFSQIRNRAETESWKDVSCEEVNALILEARIEK
ncbi:MAG: hypothetical protein FWF51_05715 [Chitinivibrionia bacterium]|nr:hypothetical protein [Chitinivibrionia bacterium]